MSVVTRTATRYLDLAAGTLSVVVLADSAVEHYRGGFYNRVMFAAPLLSSMTLATSIAAHERSAATPAHLLAVAGGLKIGRASCRERVEGVVGRGRCEEEW